MSNNKVIKSVSFNKTSEDDKKMLKHINKKRNFSGYVKKLIMQDVLQKDQKNIAEQIDLPQELPEKKIEERPLSPSEEIEQLRKQQKRLQQGQSQGNPLINLPKRQ